MEWYQLGIRRPDVNAGKMTWTMFLAHVGLAHNYFQLLTGSYDEGRVKYAVTLYVWDAQDKRWSMSSSSTNMV